MLNKETLSSSYNAGKNGMWDLQPIYKVFSCHPEDCGNKDFRPVWREDRFILGRCFVELASVMGGQRKITELL